MINDINLWRLQIGLFGYNSKSLTKSKSIKDNYSSLDLTLLLFLILISIICMQLLFVTIMHLCIFYIALLIDILSSFSLKHFLIAFLILLSGDVESNPGPNNKQTLSVFHWT